MFSSNQSQAQEQRLVSICRTGTHPFASALASDLAAIRANLKRYSCGVIVSGGQTGVDSAAFDVADALGIPRTGFAPRLFINEAGAISPSFQRTMIEVGETFGTLASIEVLKELRNPPYARWETYAERTKLNAQFSDATLIIVPGGLQGGNLVTFDAVVEHHGRSQVYVLNTLNSIESQIEEVREWLHARQPIFLNVAGSRESAGEDMGVSPYTQAVHVLTSLFAPSSQ
jgi:hypothetical protein